MSTLAVYCGSRSGAQHEYVAAATRLGELLAQREVTLVYGGANCGLMGALASAMLHNGGSVIGIVPHFFTHEITQAGLTEVRVVHSMHERKRVMVELADAFAVLPGGLGTLDEFTEVLTWAQLGHHTKPCWLLNTCGYYDLFLSFITHAVYQGFIKQEHRDAIRVASIPEELMNRIEFPR